MSVEARLLNPQLLLNKHQIMMITNAIQHNHNQSNYNAQFGYGMAPHPLSGTTTADNLLPMYGSAFVDTTDLENTAPLKAESGLTYSLPVSRKRSRDSFSNAHNVNQNLMDRCTFLGEDISFQIQQQQLEIDQFIALHTEKVRMDIEEKRKRNSRRIIAAVEEGISKRLRAKEEEIVKISKLNWALEERVKSLCAENQIWRELAQTNEATANALRSNLKQVLEQAVQEDFRYRSTTACEDDAQSCCESNNEEQRQAPENVNEDCTSRNDNKSRWCKNCGNGESSVLLLPCRHLCLCTVCASSVNMCPICKSSKNISVHVHLS